MESEVYQSIEELNVDSMVTVSQFLLTSNGHAAQEGLSLSGSLPKRMTSQNATWERLSPLDERVIATQERFPNTAEEWLSVCTESTAQEGLYANTENADATDEELSNIYDDVQEPRYFEHAIANSCKKNENIYSHLYSL